MIAKEPKLTYALDTFGKMVHISSVEAGLSCNCRCPKCNEPLIAKIGQGGRQPHFAHKKDSDCKGSYMTALHKLAEQIIKEEKAVMAPGYREIESQRLTFDEVEVEQRVERKDLQPDVVGITEDGRRWIVEILNTHEVDDIKKAKLIESGITCLEIDVSEQSLDNLKSFILDSAEDRKWINNPNYDSDIADMQRKRVSRVEKYLLDKNNITIPRYACLESTEICVKDVSILLKSDDGFYERIKVVSSNNATFVFNIGCDEILKKVNPYIGEHIEHDELTISTNKVPLDKDFHLHSDCISWLYNYKAEEDYKAIYQKYESNPDYNIRLRSYCNTQCKYTPCDGKCIYLVKDFPLKGEHYVVCNERRKQFDENIGLPIAQDEITNDILQNIENNKKERYRKEHLVGESPFDFFWTDDTYFKYLMQGSYETENGIKKDIIMLEKIGKYILLLYEDSKEEKNYTPYHIVTIFISEGKLIRDEVGVFPIKHKAIESFTARKIRMHNSKELFTQKGYDDKDLPF